MSLLRAGLRGVARTLQAESGASGSSRANPAAVNAETVAGPWKLTVTSVLTGDDATTAVTQASQLNVAPADGIGYVAVKLRATNASDRSYDIEPDDFGVTGALGILYRYSQQQPPDPPLHGTVKAGASLEGWVVAEVPTDEKNLLLVYDSLSITGSWSDCVFALSDGGTIADAVKAAQAKNDTGTSAGSPVGAGDEVVTGDWAVKLLDVVLAADVPGLFPASDYRTTALLPADPTDTWVALHFQITNVRTGGLPSFLPPTAVQLATSDGKVVNDVSLLTPPEPDASGTYYPGASRDGWVLFEGPSGYSDGTVRFLPFFTDSDPRYISYSGGGGGASPAPTADTSLTAGAKVTVTEAVVNLRSEPSTSGEVVVELHQGDALTVTGPAVAGGDYEWYPVTVDATGKTGYIAANFVAPAS
jgi:hypothetical protein